MNEKIGSGLRLLRHDEIPHILEEGELGAVLEWAVTRPDGKVIEHVVKRSESFVRQFLDLLYIQMAFVPQSAPYAIRDTGNTLRDQYWNEFAGTIWVKEMDERIYKLKAELDER